MSTLTNTMRVRAGHWAPVEFTRVARTRTAKPLKASIHGKKHSLFWDIKRDVPAIIDDICPHRGASLSEGGVVTAEGCIKCKYHGKLVGPRQADLRGVTDRNGIVYIKSGLGELPPHEKSPPTSDEFEGNRVTEYSRAFDGCSPILCVENTLDWSHLDTVHSFHLIEGKPKVTINRGGVNGKASYEYAFRTNQTLVIENEYWGPWSTCLRFIFDGVRAFTLHFSVRPESKDNARLFVRVVRDASSWSGPVGDFMYMLVNELPLIEDRYIVRHADPASWSKNKLTDDDAFLKEYRSYMESTHPDILAMYVS
jgi:phenylpropionate dioxygenase-like ring-hydroxylating dioxygenase large terminal subunit